MASRSDAANQVVIVGAGGHGRVVLDILRAAEAVGGIWQAVGFIDADPALAGTTVAGLPVFGPLNVLPRLKHQQGITLAVVAIGNNRIRRSCAAKVTAAGFRLINAIHPSAVLSNTAEIGLNVVIAPGAIVCTGVKIADSVLINTGAMIDHECSIGDSAHVASGARLAGRVTVGAGAFIGLGASVIQCLSIGNDATVGAGAVVLKDVEPRTTVVGIPARPLPPLDEVLSA